MDPVQEQNPKNPLFTIVILVPRFEHLLSVTLDSIISQTLQDFEIVLVEARELSKIEHILQSYSDIPIELHVENETNQSILMNRGLGYAKGKYVHFLYSGDFYLSQHSLAYLKEMIEKHQDPDLLYCGYLVREQGVLPSVMIKPLSLEMIRKGDLPTIQQCCWYSKKTLEKHHGFDERFSCRTVLDYISALVKSDSRIVFVPRILVDYVLYGRLIRMNLRYLSETCHVLFRHFGFWRAFLWWFLQDHIRTLKMIFLVLRKVFWGT